MNRQLITLGVIAALVFAAGAPAAKQPRPARVQANADFVLTGNCGYFIRYGHLEINAYDDDQTPVGLDTGLRQNDRISFTITYSDGETVVFNPLGVTVNGNYAVFPEFDWAGPNWNVYDYGNPGTKDLAWFDYRVGTCGYDYLSFTSGNIKITPAS